MRMFSLWPCTTSQVQVHPQRNAGVSCELGCSWELRESWERHISLLMPQCSGPLIPAWVCASVTLSIWDVARVCTALQAWLSLGI